MGSKFWRRPWPHSGTGEAPIPVCCNLSLAPGLKPGANETLQAPLSASPVSAVKFLPMLLDKTPDLFATSAEHGGEIEIRRHRQPEEQGNHVQ